ncbi:MAG: trehalose-phosphatase [Parasphingopyxis sp.]
MASTFELPAPLARLSLFLDFDGTLVPIAARPDAIQPRPGLVDLLHDVSRRLDGRLVLVSGRSIADLDRHLGRNGIAIVGSHGHELRFANGETVARSLDRDLSEIKAALEARAGDLPGLEIEMKRYGIALHYRQAPDLADKVRALAGELADALGLSVKHGKMVAEILPRGADKGEAVRAIMTREAFAGTIPLFIGDDITDEDGFRAAQQLGGLGVLVGEREGSAAAARLPSHEEVWQLLERMAAEEG